LKAIEGRMAIRMLGVHQRFDRSSAPVEQSHQLKIAVIEKSMKKTFQVPLVVNKESSCRDAPDMSIAAPRSLGATDQALYHCWVSSRSGTSLLDSKTTIHSSAISGLANRLVNEAK